MRILLDTNVVIALVDGRLRALEGAMRDVVTDSESIVHASVASLWEIAIKVRLGKLALGISPKLLPELFAHMGLQLIAISHHHVLTVAEPEPATRDLFDRLLLAQCLVEDLRLVTKDRALSSHPLAWRAA
ncbi:MAG TPA: type II toxin-antitoxin system VapC family toxin [Xanthobacteraceae bacterium]|nr:type II toxin-antitoxin system VapC family toxin [Xanthobacteraceae bacterium]